MSLGAGMAAPTLGLKEWWARLDKTLLSLFGGLIVIGIVLTTAAGPVAAERKGIADLHHFVERQFLFMLPALGIMAIAAMMSVKQVRRAGTLLALGAFGLMLLTLVIGPEIKGATRWLTLPGMSLQPSELFKPGFVIMVSWFLAEAARDANFPGTKLSLGALFAGAGVLLLQPDYGQLTLLIAIWGVVFFVAGRNWLWLGGIGAFFTLALGFGYRFAPHVKSRIDRFLSPDGGDTYQVDTALRTIGSGGLLGHDLAQRESVKNSLPDAHTDFVFAVAAEEFGLILCLTIIALFGGIVWRCLDHAAKAESLFVRCAISGLAAQLAFQAFVNMGVTLSLLPAKGMTLPFISYGGSSLLATGLTAGFLLALTRSRGNSA